MKIGFLTSKYSFGGGEHVMLILIKQMAELGHDVQIYTWEPEWKHIEKDININVNLISNPPIGWMGKLKSIFSLTKSLVKTKPECLIVFSLYLAEVALFSTAFSRVPIIISERVDPRYLPTERIHRSLRLIIYFFCQGIVFQTTPNSELYIKKIRRKSIVINNPIITRQITTTNNFVKEKVIIGVGRLSEEKNFTLLIKAFGKLKLPDYILKIYGKGPLENKLKELIFSMRLEDRVFLEGHVNKLDKFLRNSDIYVLSSNHEGVPNSLIEAMTLGMACIGTDVPSGGVRTLINHNYNGLIVPVNDIDKLAQSISDLVYDRNLNLRLRNNAMNISEVHTAKNVTEQWIYFLKKIIQ